MIDESIQLSNLIITIRRAYPIGHIPCSYERRQQYIEFDYSSWSPRFRQSLERYEDAFLSAFQLFGTVEESGESSTGQLRWGYIISVSRVLD